ncbi:MAG: hypothetical protein GY696_17410 [Gammaproteobacteria bacterium]|nr:hypothetical protein [Gammaproteobacteria bacterium]
MQLQILENTQCSPHYLEDSSRLPAAISSHLQAAINSHLAATSRHLALAFTSSILEAAVPRVLLQPLSDTRPCHPILVAQVDFVFPIFCSLNY